MASRSQRSADSLVHIHRLANPALLLNLTGSRWLLPDGQASVMVGMDVIEPGRLRTERGRRPVGNDCIPVEDQPIVAAWPGVSVGLTSVRYSDVYTTVDYAGVGNPDIEKLDPPYWPVEMAGATFIRNDDERISARVVTRITKVGENANTPAGVKNDVLTLEFNPALVVGDKFSIVYTKEFDQRGVWMSNGRKIWLHSGGVLSLYIDLGTDDAKGVDHWEMSRIAHQLVMFVSPLYAPRIVRLDDSPLAAGQVSTGTSLAGCPAPRKPESVESRLDDDERENRSFDATITAGSMEAGDYRFSIRAVNLDDGAESQFVGVVDVLDLDDLDFNLPSENSGLRVRTFHTATVDATTSPIVSERWTHLEFWRTTAGTNGIAGAAIYLERRFEIPRLRHMWENYTAGLIRLPTRLMLLTPNNQNPYDLSNNVIVGHPLATANDLLSGVLPPYCKGVASLLGVTLCAGAASGDRTLARLSDRNYHVEGICDWSPANRELVYPANGILNYTFAAGDTFVWIGSDDDHSGEFEIESRKDERTLVLKSAAGLPSAAVANVWGYIRHEFEWDEWPTIESDEHLWYSRTDKSAPESFQIVKPDGSARILRLSEFGDQFRRMVVVANYVVVIMGEGVHLLFFSGTNLLTKDTVAATAEGTPWGQSVVVVGNRVFWATPRGISVMQISNAPSIDGHRGRISRHGEGILGSWFQEAFDNGQNIDAGYDSVHECLRFRRRISSNEFSVLQTSLATGRSTLIDDDNGARYVQAKLGDDVRLQTVTEEGALFEVNADATDDPYEGIDLQAVLDESYEVVSHIRIRKPGAFTPLLCGEVIRFRGGEVDGAVRVIRQATADEIRFDSLAGLAAGVEIVIAARRFRVRWAHLAGTLPTTLKTLQQLTVDVVPGTRHTPAAGRGMVNLAVYEDFSDVPARTLTDDVTPRTPGKVDAKSIHTVSSLEAQGSAIEIEVSGDDARMEVDFREVMAVVVEEATELTDAMEDK